ncbi:MAG: DUF4920 domain-containing protein [Calditrichaeota bacterium]|nr:DUF4920 domain-containing protein [Calditrichota bacterium]
MNFKSVIITSLILAGLLFAADTKNFGEKLTLNETTQISKINETPEDFVDKAVLVEGRIIDVCKKRGCWIKIAGDKEFESILVKVDDGVIIFPMESKGKMAKVEGKIEKVEYTMEQTIEKEKHKCEMEGKEFDASKVTKPDVLYRLRALGADIEM